MKVLVFIAFLSSLFAFAGCENRIKDDNGVVLARVFDDYLYEEDLANIVPANTSHRDSIFIVRNFVNNWIRTKLMVEKAKYNLTNEQLDFDQRLEEYENSLIIYEYESKLLSQKLDTTVSDNDLQTFYQNHKTDFELKENIVRVFYAVVDKDLPDINDIIDVFSLSDSLVIDSLELLSEYHNFKIYTDTSIWISLDELKRNIPIETYNQELFLKDNRFIQLSDENYTFMLMFVDFKIKDDISPFVLVKNNIRKIILAKRKTGLIKKVREEIFNQASTNNDFEIYYHE